MLRPLLLVGALAASAGASPRAGKVIRVERAPGKPPGVPRICSLSASDLSAYCAGKKPESGDVVIAIDSHHVVATLRVESATPFGACAQGQQWQSQLRLDSGDLGASTSDPLMYGLLDVQLDPRSAHVVKADRVPGDRQVSRDNVIAIDSDGDDAPDLEFVQISCDDASGTTTATGTCLEVWYAVGRRFELLRTDRIATSCY